MRKKLLYFTVIATIVLFVACNNEDSLLETERTFSLTASMPDEDPSTRVSLAPDGKNVILSWTENDVIDLVFVQGSNKVRTPVEVNSVSNDGKTAHFDINIPASFTGNFHLYGVHGGQGTDPNETTRNHALLPTNPGRGNAKDIMLYFKYEMQPDDTHASVSFQHLGSIFSITLRNNSGSTYAKDFNEFRLVGVDNVANTNWAYNSGSTTGQIFDLTEGVAGEFLNQENAGNYISFSTNFNNINNGENTISWGWYPPLPGKRWPALQLQLIDANGDLVRQSVNTKPEKTADPVVGKAYHFYATWDGTELNFTDDQFVVPTTP